MHALIAVLAAVCIGPEGLPVSLADSPQDPPPGPYRRKLNETLSQKAGQSLDLFALNGLAPLPSGRDSAWHGFLGTPVLQEASLAKTGSWRATFWIDTASADLSSSDGGGESRFHAASMKETVGAEYAPTDRIVIGARLTAGELGGASDRIVVFQDNVQIVPQGERGFGIESLTIHGRWVIPTPAVNVGAAVQVKLPIGKEEDLLTSQTTDVAATLLASKRWGALSVTGNLGIVAPLGDSELFDPDQDLNPYVHGGVSAGWQAFSQVAFIGQLEFNTSAYSDLDAISGSVAVAMIGARARLSENFLAHVGVGSGLTEAAGDLNFTLGAELRF